MSPHDTFYALVIFLALTVALMSCDCPPERKEQYHDEAKLNQDLLCAYNVDFRPVKDHRTAVNVSVQIAVRYLSFDSLEETFTVHNWLFLSWVDEFLQWEPSDYGNIKETQIESTQIWTPKMALFNADATVYQLEQIYTTCLLNNAGNVTCVPYVAHSGICHTNIRSWPYDTQNCTMYFGSWMNTGEQINYTFHRKNPVILKDFTNGPGWTLLRVSIDFLPGKYKCCPNETYPMLKYTFTLKRVAAGPAALVVVPTVVIVLLTLISMILDVRDNTRLMLICFSLYGHFIFLTEVGYQIPKHSAETPIILLFLRDSMMITLAGILETLFLMYLRRRAVPAPGWIVRMNRLVNSGASKYVVFTEFDPTEAVDIKTSTEDNADMNEAKTDWIQLANLLNSALFIIAVLVYIALICMYIPRDK